MLWIVRLVLVVACVCSMQPSIALAEQAEDVTKARALIEQGKYSEAVDYLRETGSEERIANDPAFILAYADAYWRTAPSRPIVIPNAGRGMQKDCYIDSANYYRHVMALESATDAQKKYAEDQIEKILDSLADLGDAAYEKKDYEEAVRLAGIMFGVAPDDDLGPTVIIEIGTETNNLRWQLHGLTLLINTKPKYADAYIYAAELETTPDLGRGAEYALQHIDAGLAVLPGDYTLLHERARWLIELDRKDDATQAIATYEEQLNKTLKDDKQRALYTATVGMLHERMGNKVQAVARYEQALAAKPDLLQARYALGALLFQEGIDALLQIPDLPRDKQDEIKALRNSATASFKAARPHMEYYHANAKPDLTIMRSLQEIYQQLNDDQALIKITGEIKKVQRGEPIR